MHAEDPEHTNDKGSDNRTFVTGDAIGAVVNGRIPAHLLNPFTSYSITDDWTASAQWIDWTHKDQVRVYVDGKDVTDQFDITIDAAKHTTTATAKGGFLTKTAFGTVDRKVKLYIAASSGRFRTPSRGRPEETDQQGHRNLEQRIPADQRAAGLGAQSEARQGMERRPGPGRERRGLGVGQQRHADTHTFVQQDDFGVTVNGLLPRNLARKMLLRAWR